MVVEVGGLGDEQVWIAFRQLPQCLCHRTPELGGLFIFNICVFYFVWYWHGFGHTISGIEAREWNKHFGLLNSSFPGPHSHPILQRNPYSISNFDTCDSTHFGGLHRSEHRTPQFKSPRRYAVSSDTTITLYHHTIGFHPGIFPSIFLFMSL